MCAVSPRTGPGRSPAEAPARGCGGARGVRRRREWWSPRAGPGCGGAARTGGGPAGCFGCRNRKSRCRLPSADPRPRDLAPVALNRQCAMEALPRQAHGRQDQSVVSISFWVFHKAVTGVTVATSVDGSASIDKVPTRRSPGPPHGGPGEPARRPTAGQPGRRRQPSSRHREGGGTRATRVARLPRDTHGRTPNSARVCAVTVGTGVALPRPHTKPPYTMGKEADGTGAKRRPVGLVRCPGPTPASTRHPRSPGRPADRAGHS